MLDATDRPFAQQLEQSSVARSSSARGFTIDAEMLAAAALLSATLVVGAATLPDYGITIDEFNVNDYGPKALAWFTSGFHDRSTFDAVEDTLWYYGPWFHILVTLVQSLLPANPWTIRHAMTFAIGILGIAALLPMGRLAFGRWAGLAATALCLGTGYLYGSLFFTPIDIPFLAVMTWATLAIMAMARDIVPAWPAAIAAGVLCGLAIATRSSGVITQVYLIGAMILCGLAAYVESAGSCARKVRQIAARTIGALVVGWIVAVATWPWLQVGNPFSHFKAAFLYFANHPNSFETRLWGRMVVTTDLPWYYIPGQLAARLPEGFLLLLLAGTLFALGDCISLAKAPRNGSERSSARRSTSAINAIASALADRRERLIVWAALLLPIGFIIAAHSTLYDGIRHVLFLIPLFALVGGYGFARALPKLCRFPLTASVFGGIYASVIIWNLAVLHPLEYVAMNALAGGVQGAYGRFDMDYWAVAATVAARRLEGRLDYASSPEAFAISRPGITVCMGYREALVAPLLERPWRIEVDPAKADYVVATERWPCAESLMNMVLIDEVRRFGRPFAWVYARRQPGSDGQSISTRE